MSGNGAMVVTGGSRGIGAATAKLAAAAGYAVLLNYARDAESAASVVAEIEASGGVAQAKQADVAQEAEVLALFDAAQSMGELTALVNNAGVLEHQMPFAQQSLERWQRVMNINVIGSMLCAREAARRWSDAATPAVDHRRGIVNLSSMAAKLGAPGEYVDYAVSKGAIDSLTKGLALELAPLGARVNGVRPGVIETEIHASGGEPDRVERVAASVPMGRGGTAKEVAQAIMWLLSEQASYVTGTSMDVTGGR